MGANQIDFLAPQFWKWVLVVSSQAVKLLSHHCFIKGRGLSGTQGRGAWRSPFCPYHHKGKAALGECHVGRNQILDDIIGLPHQTKPEDLPPGTVWFPELAHHLLLLEDEVGFLFQGLTLLHPIALMNG